MESYLLGLGTVIHSILVLLYSYDLLTRSKRHNKINWLILISLIPFVGVIIYELTKKRRKKFNVR